MPSGSSSSGRHRPDKETEMTDAGRGDSTIDNYETVEDAAGRFLAAGLSLGILWWADAPNDDDGYLDTFQDGRLVRNPEMLLISRPGKTEEQACRYLPKSKKKWPAWLLAASEADQRRAKQWSASNKLDLGRGQGIIEFKEWERRDTFGFCPRPRESSRAQIALHDAKLSGPLLPLLRLVTLEDIGEWPTVLRYLTAKGHRPAPCVTAMRKVLYPYARVVSVDAEADVRVSVYRAEVRAAREVLERWLRIASWRFMRAHGWPPRMHDKDAFIPNVRRPKLARPRLEGGIDWQVMPPAPWCKKRNGEPSYYKRFRAEDQKINKGRIGTGSPAPCHERHGALAAAYCARHPAQERLTWSTFDDAAIARTSRLHDYWGAEDERANEAAMAERLEYERDAPERDAEEREERDAETTRQAV